MRSDGSITAARGERTHVLDAAPQRTAQWARRVRTRVALGDAIAVYAAVFVAFELRLGADDLRPLDPHALRTHHAVTSLVLVVGWLAVLWLAGSLSVSDMGAGSQEFARVAGVTLAVFGVAGMAAYLLRWDLGRAYVAVALPLGLLFLGAGRYLMRCRLVAERRAGHHLSSALAVGSRDGVARLIEESRRVPQAGLEIVAACVRAADPGDASVPVAGVPVVGDESGAVTWVARNPVDAVVVAGPGDVPPRVLQRLAWGLEPHEARLVISPGILDVAPPRVRLWPMPAMPAMPLVRVESPGYRAPHQRAKRVVDMVGAALLIVVLAVPLVVAALAVRLTSPGPVLFRQVRVGEDGKPFQILKFRSMVTDAESHLEDVLDGSADLFYKAKDDPRVTRVGVFLRRHSIDELPQLFNVLGGSMSLVGPRPHTPHGLDPARVELSRRVLVKPGMTGLWQVSGRNDLTPEQSLRLDLYYVENWSMTNDMRILLRTARAVVVGDGAY